MNSYLCSVVVPSRNRLKSLERLLVSLTRQDVASDTFETIVVLDGSTDTSADMLDDWRQATRLPHLRYLAQTHAGASAARNRGAHEACAPVVLFLDDDMEADPSLIRKHLIHHDGDARVVVLGDCPVVPRHRAAMHDLSAWIWWEEKLQARSRPGAVPRYTDFCTGNVSLCRRDFLAVGGFDDEFRGYGREDYELGLRLLVAGIQFVVEPGALARHHHASTLKSTLRRQSDEAVNEVILGYKHPEVRGGLRLTTFPNGLLGSMCRTAFVVPLLTDSIATVGELALSVLGAISMRRTWIRWFNALRDYWYWRGVASVLGSVSGLSSYLAAIPRPPLIHVDIVEGLPEDPEAQLTPAQRGSPVDVVISGNGQPLTMVTVRGGIGSPHAFRDELYSLVTADPHVRLWLAMGAPNDGFAAS